MNTLANTYYLKALDAYPYQLSEFLEAINYALSYDDANADAHCLMGRFYMEELYQFEKAKIHFETALNHDINHVQTYYYFIRWSIDCNELDLAKKLIDYARSIQGISKDTLMHREATIYEKMGKFKKAEKLVDQAIETSIFNWDISFYKEEKKRIVEKQGDKTKPVKQKKK